MSDSLMRDVKQVTEQGCTVVATIHQPSEAVFTRFDKVLLLETGRATWLGSQLFVEIGALCLLLFWRPMPDERVARSSEKGEAHQQKTSEVAYYGVISGLRGSLGSLGFTCPEGTPLPEILLDLLEVPAEEAARAAYTEKLGKLKQLSDARIA